MKFIFVETNFVDCMIKATNRWESGESQNQQKQVRTMLANQWADDYIQMKEMERGVVVLTLEGIPGNS